MSTQGIAAGLVNPLLNPFYGIGGYNPVRTIRSEERSLDPKPSPVAPSDAELLSQIRSGHSDAMSLLYDRYGRVVFSIAVRILNDRSAAEDVLQEVFVQLWRNPNAYVPERGNLCAWLAVVARNRSIDLIRRRHPEDNIEDVVLTSNAHFENTAERDCMMARVRTLMESLPKAQRALLEMAFFEGRTHTEIADQTGEPLGTVKTRIRTALLSLRKALHA